jgi:hypothetical protein
MIAIAIEPTVNERRTATVAKEEVASKPDEVDAVARGGPVKLTACECRIKRATPSEILVQSGSPYPCQWRHLLRGNHIVTASSSDFMIILRIVLNLLNVRGRKKRLKESIINGQGGNSDTIGIALPNFMMERLLDTIQKKNSGHMNRSQKRHGTKCHIQLESSERAVPLETAASMDSKHWDLYSAMRLNSCWVRQKDCYPETSLERHWEMRSRWTAAQ